MSKKLRVLLIVFFSIVFCFSIYMLISDIVESHREKEAFSSLAEIVHAREQYIIENEVADTSAPSDGCSTSALNC